MALSVNKVAPSAVVLAFVGYCIWPSVAELASTPRPPKESKDAMELSASLFSPTLPPPPTRNPWGGLDAAALAAAKEAAKAGEKVAEASDDSDTAKKTNEPIDPLKSLKLDATCIFGNQRMAMINGRMYANRETVVCEGASTAEYQIVDVLPYKVVLERKGKTIELTYSSGVGDSASSPRAGMHGKSRATAATSREKKSPTTSTVATTGGNKLSSNAGN